MRLSTRFDTSRLRKAKNLDDNLHHFGPCIFWQAREESLSIGPCGPDSTQSRQASFCSARDSTRSSSRSSRTRTRLPSRLGTASSSTTCLPLTIPRVSIERTVAETASGNIIGHLPDHPLVRGAVIEASRMLEPRGASGFVRGCDALMLVFLREPLPEDRLFGDPALESSCPLFARCSGQEGETVSSSKV